MRRPLVMGILNVTPDSFSDGGRFNRPEIALKHAEALVTQGADILDIGGESTRPGATPVSADEELSRIIPVIEAIQQRLDVKLSVDTSKPVVMREVLALGVDLINDVNALEATGAIELLASANCHVCLMHKKGQPGSMQQKPQYLDVVKEVYDYLASRIDVCVAAGIQRERIIIDVGFGFGKSVEHNLSLIKHLATFKQFALPILVGVSRKSTIGAVLGSRKMSERLEGSLALAMVAYTKGANILRVHDVRATVDVFKMLQAVQEAT